MALETKLSLKLSQKLTMTPMMQQAIRLLPMTRLELIQSIRQEMEENPLLEEDIGTENGLETAGDETVDQEEKEEEREDPEFEQEAVIEEKVAAPAKEEIDWSQFIQEKIYVSSAVGQGFDDRPSLDNVLRKEVTLSEHLTFQLSLNAQSEEDKYIGALIIGNIDSNGYLGVETAEIAELSGLPVEKVERVLKLVQSFDPTGVGARNLQECLSLQAEARFPDRPEVKTLIEKFLYDLNPKNLPKIAKALNMEKSEVISLLRLLKELDPNPGLAFNPEEIQYIIPDVYVVKVGDEYQVIMNDDGIPNLRINPYYQSILQNKDGPSDGTRDFVESKLKSALWLIKSIGQRKQTLFKVTHSLIKFQGEFLEYGLSRLKPLVLRDVAEDVGMHESTISRVTTNKYIHTPQGIFPMKFFFHSSIDSFVGSALSSVRVKEMIKKIVQEEDEKKPATDEEIVQILQTRDVKIARRTVTKYRKELKIPPASKRKRFIMDPM
jgi:RNA polymerase sigma-54 factor